MSAMGHTKLTDTSNGYRALRVRMLDDVAIASSSRSTRRPSSSSSP